MGYLGDTFGRPCPDQLPFDESDPNSDMFAFPSESREFLTGLYRTAWAHSDATIEALPLDAVGRVPWWPAEHSRSRCTTSWSAWSPRPPGTPATPISFANSSTAPPA